MIGCIIQARMGSTRLPGKVLKNLDSDKTVLDYVIQQLRNSKLIDKLVIATTDLEEDEVITKHARVIGIEYFRGSSLNVLDRFYNCAKKFSFSTIVRITADCPLIDPQIVDLVIKKFKEQSYDYGTNCFPRTFPYGTEVEVFSFNALERMWKNATMPYEKEHVTPYIKEHNEEFRIFNIKNKKDISNYRYVIDVINDLQLVRKIVSNIKKKPILMNDIVDLLSNNSKLMDVNKDAN